MPAPKSELALKEPEKKAFLHRLRGPGAALRGVLSDDFAAKLAERGFPAASPWEAPALTFVETKAPVLWEMMYEEEEEGPGDPEEGARESVATTVLFGDEIDLPLADVEAARRHGWVVARPDAYPSVFHKERGLSRRPPLVRRRMFFRGRSTP